MYYNSIYSQLFNFIPRYRFEKIVKKSGGDRYCKHFTAWKQFLTLLFAQISGKDSLREIENALRANHKRLYHLGMEAVAKSTLSEAMNRRNPEMFKVLFEEILDRVMVEFFGFIDGLCQKYAEKAPERLYCQMRKKSFNGPQGPDGPHGRFAGQ